MADLPDIDTSQVSFLKFWNAIDQGGTADIDPDSALTDTRTVDYTLYDNGWEGTYDYELPELDTLTVGERRQCTVRIKEDGWIVAYLDRTTSADTLESSDRTNHKDFYDFAGWTKDWTVSAARSGLEDAISDLQAELDSAADITYNRADVGVWFYPDTTVTDITTISANTPDNNAENRDFDFSHTTETDLVEMWATCANRPGVDNGGMTLDGVTVQAEDVNLWGHRDLLVEGEFPDPGVTWSVAIRDSGANAYTTGAIIAVWK